ncbi:hypothetical protein [Maridesulfovibrio zosterae]|uniref:hypothetical protein n=1 Tax=Maridesulfovibrio zosterae TaxID=82171 RepID=UPI0004173FA8|nr:hypothetical protein [Maridesulfovibrio zosterae]
MFWESITKASAVISIVSFILGFGAAKIHTKISFKNSGNINSKVSKKMSIKGNNNKQMG